MLSPKSPTGVVPADISPESLAMLRRALDHGLITLSSRPIGLPEKAPTVKVEEVFALIDQVTDVKELSGTFVKVQKEYLPKLDGVTLSQLMRLVVEHEAESQCRDDIINWFMRALDRTGGITEISDEAGGQQKVLFTKEPGQKDVEALRESGAAPQVETVSEKELEELF